MRASRDVSRMAVGAFAVVCVVPPARAFAQRFPAWGGVGGSVAATSSTQAGLGVSWIVDGDVGYVGMPNAHLVIGAERYHSHRSADVQGTRETNHVTSVGARARLRFDPMEPERRAGYVAVGAMLLDVRTSAPAGVARWPREGWRAGASVAAGWRIGLDAACRTLFTGELERVLSGKVTHWGFSVGFRHSPRSRCAEPRPED